MKKLQCEACGGTEIKKVGDNLFECQSCGVQYSAVEVKKLLVEISGTVKVDQSDEMKNLYQLARRAKDTNNANDAIKYYEMILVLDSNSWEALLYSKCFKADECTIAQISDVAYEIKGCINHVFRMICEQLTDPKQKREKIGEAILVFLDKLQLLHGAAINSANSTYQSYIDSEFHFDKSDFTRVAEKAISRISPIGLGFIELGDAIFKSVVPADEEAKKCILIAWEEGLSSIQFVKKELVGFQKNNYTQQNANIINNLSTIETATIEKIKKINPNYVASRVTQAQNANSTATNYSTMKFILSIFAILGGGLGGFFVFWGLDEADPIGFVGIPLLIIGILGLRYLIKGEKK